MAHSLFKPKRRDSRTGKRKVGRYWHGQYRLEGDAEYTRVSLRTTDKRVAQQRLDELVEREERLRAGIIAPVAQTEAANTSLADHLAAFIEYQRRRNCSRGYTQKIDQRVTKLIAECAWKRVRDVTAESFIAWRHAQTLTPKTLNDYQHAIHAVLAWLKKTGRIEVNPIESVGRVDGCGKQSFVRRAFTDEEVGRLLAVSETRRPIYLLALHTGLRLGELRALRWDDIDLERAIIRLRAEATRQSGLTCSRSRPPRSRSSGPWSRRARNPPRSSPRGCRAITHSRRT
jgi:integrase